MLGRRVHFKGPGLGDALDAIFGDVPSIPHDFQPPTMSNHPNRNPNSASASPTPAQVAAARMAAGLSYAECGALVHERAIRWAAFEQGDARMHPAAWELFLLKVENMRHTGAVR